MIKKNTGTYEWAESTVNIQIGCEHNCRYCYARANAVRFKRIANAADWSEPVINQKSVDKNYIRKSGVIMFPSTHDITPNNIYECLCVILRLIHAGNQLLIVSKPHLTCIELICERLVDYRSRVQFRFTIGSTRDDVLAFWEPGAPGLEERLDCLKHAHFKGYRTSVSAEPHLDSTIENLYISCFPYITDSFWIGTLREFKRRVDKSGISVEQMYDFVRPILECQSNSAIWRLYEKLNGRPFIKWKDSIRKIVGIID